MADRQDADRYLFGPSGARTVLLPAVVAAYLYDEGGLKELRQRKAGMYAELDDALLAFALVADEFRQRRGSAVGTKPVPTAEPAPGLEEPVSAAVAAERLGITDRAVRKAVAEGRLRGMRVDGRWRIDAASVRQYQHRMAA